MSFACAQPSAINDLKISRTFYSLPDRLILQWTAPASATQYDIRYSTSSITESNWDSANQVSNEPIPSSGEKEVFTVTGLSNNTNYYFAIKSSDGNSWSDLSIIATNNTLPAVVASNGSAKAIQEAINKVASSGGTVYIPAGNWDFVGVGEDWGRIYGQYKIGPRVVVPSGVSILGADTEKDANGQVKVWKTILRLPWDVPGTWHYSGKIWFEISGKENPDKPSRFSNIKFVGYRSIDPNSTASNGAISVKNVVNFRIDHCYFEHTVLGVSVSGSNGVIDHSFFVNPVAAMWGPTLDNMTMGYGVGVYRGNGDLWENDVRNVLGKYTNYTVVIEDNYFEKWRHCVAANSGAHYVFRHNIIKNDFGFGSLDAHGWGTMENGKIIQVGTRAVEIYENQILDAIETSHVTFIRGGSGVAFNNIVSGGTYRDLIYFSNEAQESVSKCYCKDWWIWNNTLSEGIDEVVVYKDPSKYYPHENMDYFLHAPDTFDYEPYVYPHPLTLEGLPEFPNQVFIENSEHVNYLPILFAVIFLAIVFWTWRWSRSKTNVKTKDI